ncbi:SGNH/GDSL hydrolase family protein [Gammaproteobacteria bacterium]|nr:SGNH/GDSL hydrolase family protein [Gammaproteobacteria bacterium]
MNDFSVWLNNLLKRQLLSIRKSLIILFIFCAFAPLATSTIIGYQIAAQYIVIETFFFAVLIITSIFILMSLGFLLTIDITFRVFYFLSRGHKYKLEKRVEADRLLAKPHPYVPYVYKPNHGSGLSNEVNYPLHKGKFSFSKLVTNKMGFANGPNGNRDVSQNKPKNFYRINCLGASTTGNYLTENNQNYSYPLMLEKILSDTYNSKIEVNNFGQGGYNSADILVRFLLDIIETSPDLVIIYHGYNDIDAYLKPGFKSDYSHSRKSLGEEYWKFEIGDKIPSLPFHFIHFLFDKWFPISSRNSLLDFVSKGDIDLKQDPSQGLIIFKRNLENLIKICLSKNIDVAISTFCHFMYKGTEKSSFHRKYNEIVAKENEIIRQLSEKYKVTLIDNAAMMPNKEKYFVDTVHFTPDGMKLLAKNIANSLKSILRKY